MPAFEAVTLSILAAWHELNTLGLMVRRRAIAGAACVHLAAMRAVSNHGQQVRTRGHPSRRPRHSASKTRVNALRARAPQDEVGVVKDSQALFAGVTNQRTE